MKISLVAVTSIDGKLTEGSNTNIHEWTSKEDAKHFSDYIKKSKLMLMGRKTYEVMNIKPSPNRLCVVMTRQPELFAAKQVADRLEFTDETPPQLVSNLEARGYSEMLLAGGGEVYASFMDAGLVSELVITIEPYLFGQGTELLPHLKSSAKLKLREMKKLNEQGTLLLTYQVLY